MFGNQRNEFNGSIGVIILYNSALDTHNKRDGSVNNYHNGTAFVHNILNGTDERFLYADAIYSEISWQKGFEKFMKRANVEDFRTYKEYIDSIIAVVKWLGVPTILICGKTGITGYDWKHETYFSAVKCKAVAYGFNCKKVKFDTTDLYMDYLAETKETLLDFCCGYGNILRFCDLHDTKFICSDINEDCINYIKGVEA